MRTYMTGYCAKVTTTEPYATSAVSGNRLFLDRVNEGAVGVVIEGADAQGDVTVLFDDCVEQISLECLMPHYDPTRHQMWADYRFLADDEYEAMCIYWRAIAALNRRAAQAVKRCVQCEEDRHLDDFGFDANRRDGYEVRCRDCRAWTYKAMR